MKYGAGFIFFLSLLLPAGAANDARFAPADAPQPRSPLGVAAVDFLLPGYGTYVQNEPVYAAAYATANLTNLVLIYMTYRNWQYYESVYQAAAVRQAMEPDKLYFADPTGGSDFLSLQDIKNRAERGQLFFTLTIIGNIALRSLSAWHSFNLADAARTKAGPRYEFYPEQGGMRAQAGYFFYF